VLRRSNHEKPQTKIYSYWERGGPRGEKGEGQLIEKQQETGSSKIHRGADKWMEVNRFPSTAPTHNLASIGKKGTVREEGETVRVSFSLPTGEGQEVQMGEKGGTA